MKLYNDVLREVAADTGAEMIDLAPQMPKDITSFYDDVHFNDFTFCGLGCFKPALELPEWVGIRIRKFQLIELIIFAKMFQV